MLKVLEKVYFNLTNSEQLNNILKDFDRLEDFNISKKSRLINLYL